MVIKRDDNDDEEATRRSWMIDEFKQAQRKRAEAKATRPEPASTNGGTAAPADRLGKG